MLRIHHHDAYEKILVELRPDPKRPHSSTASRPKTAQMHDGWYSIRDDRKILRAVIVTKARAIRLLGVSLPDTIMVGLPGRAVRDLIDHPGIDPSAVVWKAQKVLPLDEASEDVFQALPWIGIETRKALIETHGEYVDRKPPVADGPFIIG